MTQTLKLAPHYKMFIETVYRDYKDGLLTVKGAVYSAVAATWKFGEPVNLNVSAFLEETGIHPRSYARAVASLIEEGRLDLPPNALQTLRIPTHKGTRQPLHYSLSTSSGQICPENGQICPDSGQICDRGGQICPDSGQICQNDRPKTPLEAEFGDPIRSQDLSDLSLSSGEREEDVILDEYEEWLTRKAQQLPTPPTLMEEWIDKNRNKKSNRKQYLKYKQALNKASVPPPAAAAIFSEENETQKRLDLLNFWCESGDREKAIAAINAHPEWNLVATANGVEAEL